MHIGIHTCLLVLLSLGRVFISFFGLKSRLWPWPNKIFCWWTVLSHLQCHETLSHLQCHETALSDETSSQTCTYTYKTILHEIKSYIKSVSMMTRRFLQTNRASFTTCQYHNRPRILQNLDLDLQPYNDQSIPSARTRQVQKQLIIIWDPTRNHTTTNARICKTGSLDSIPPAIKCTN